MTIGTLFRYLIGRREAILAVANTPSAVWLGMLLVLSAGFAREYDAQYLVRKPWYLLLPLVASLGTSFLLYSLIYLVALKRSAERVPFGSTYRRFLALYWMTAPLAWLYAIPVERFLSDVNAMKANLVLLATVSIWRVSLMTRVVSVFIGAGIGSALAIVMLFASGVALVILRFTPLPIFNIMGGIPLSEREALIQGTAIWVTLLAVPTWFIALLAVLGQFGMSKSWHVVAVSEPRGRIAPSLWSLAVAATVGWFTVLPFTQSEQRLRYEAEQDLEAGRIEEALSLMSRYQQSDFPPHWDPPPWIAYANPRPPLIDVLEALVAVDRPAWVRAKYVEKLEAKIETNWLAPTGLHGEPEPAVRSRRLQVIERLPERSVIVDRCLERFQWSWRDESDPALKERLRALIERAGHEPKDPLPQPISTPATPGPPSSAP